MDGCDRKYKAKGYCKRHYQKHLYRNGSVKKRRIFICTIEGCNNIFHAKDYCKKHYMLWYRYGDPKIQPRSKKENGSGYKNKYGYIILYLPNHPFSGKTGKISEHRLVLGEHIGRKLYDDETVHHKNGKRDDNRLENLELKASIHLRGQDVDDLLEYATEIFRRYKPEALNEEYLTFGNERKDRRERLPNLD